MTRLPTGKTRLDIVKQAAASAILNPGLSLKRGRMIVNLDRLAEDPRNERKTFTGMEELIESIRQVGLVEPITVSAENDGTLRIVTGHRRYRAARAAGLHQVEVIIRDSENERSRRIKSVISNVQRENINAYEMAEALRSMIDDGYAADQQELARCIGKRKQWVSDILSILKLPTELAEQIKLTPIGYDAASRIAREKDPVLQSELLTMAAGGASGKAIRRHIDQRRSNSKISNELHKPKRVFRTPHRITVIVQSETADLKHADVLSALRDALDQAEQFLK